MAQLDKASDYESEDWGFKSLQEYFFCCIRFLFEGSVVPRGVSFADIAQLGERQTEDLKVPGSIPGVGIALVAQSVEHGSNKPRVGGSSPSWSTCGPIV